MFVIFFDVEWKSNMCLDILDVALFSNFIKQS